MKAAEAVVKILEMEGITHGFGIPGASINSLYQYLEKSRIKHYTTRHEEAAIHAAGGYYRASGKIAAAFCTSGPGATNFVTGLYTCNIDSVPVIAFTGQAVRGQLGRDAFQCVDIAEICAPVTKAAFTVLEPEQLPRILRDAFRIAREGKPGPVVIDLPLDVQTAEIDFSPETYQPLPIERPLLAGEQLQQAYRMVFQAAAPVLLVGGGVVQAGAERECLRFAELMQIPVITTYMAKGAVPEDHPLNAGHAGIQVGQPLGNKVMLESDVVLAVGNRFTDRHTGDLAVYRGERRFIHINIEKRELNKIFPADLAIQDDAKKAMGYMVRLAEKDGARDATPRVAALPELRRTMQRPMDMNDVPIHPHRLFKEINAFFGDNTIFTTGCGITQIWSGQLQQINKSRRYLPSGGAGTLGYDIPAAFGAHIAKPHRQTVAVMGDFGFTFHVQELAVCAKYKVPVIVIVLNNAYLGLIRQNQKYAYGYEYAVEMAENQGMIDYVKVAEGFACYGERVFKPEDLPAAFQRAVDSGKPAVIDVICATQTDCAMGSALDNVKEFV